jgi:hypothetical protein
MAKPPITVVMTFDPADMARRGRIGAYRLHATHDPRETTVKGRQAFEQRFLDEVDPKRELPEEERHRRATYARRAYFSRLARASAQARSRRAARRRQTGAGADATTAMQDPVS